MRLPPPTPRTFDAPLPLPKIRGRVCQLPRLLELIRTSPSGGSATPNSIRQGGIGRGEPKGNNPVAERDRDYEEFHAEWKPRLGLKDREIAESYMRGSDPSWDRVRPEDVPHVPGE